MTGQFRVPFCTFSVHLVNPWGRLGTLLYTLQHESVHYCLYPTPPSAHFPPGARGEQGGRRPQQKIEILGFKTVIWP